MPSMERELLQKEHSTLEQSKDVEGLKNLAEDATLLGHEDIAQHINETIARLSSEVESVEKITPGQASQIEKLGGNNSELENRTGEVDQKIDRLKDETINQIDDVVVTSSRSTEDIRNEAEATEAKRKFDIAQEGSIITVRDAEGNLHQGSFVSKDPQMLTIFYKTEDGMDVAVNANSIIDIYTPKKENSLSEKKEELTPEQIKKIEELSNKKYDLNRQTENEIKSVFNELIDKYTEDMQKAEALLQKAIHEDSLYELIKLVNSNPGSIKNAINDLNYDDPVSGSGDQRRKIEDLDKKIENNGIAWSKIDEESKKTGEKSDATSSTIDEIKQGWGTLRNRMAQTHMKMGPQGREIKEKLAQQEKNVEQKIKTRADDFMDTQGFEIGKYKQDLDSLQETKDLVTLRNQMIELENKKTGLFFSQNKKNEQMSELKAKINNAESKISKFKRERKKKIIDSLEDFKDKFHYSSVKYDEAKYSKLYNQANEV